MSDAKVGKKIAFFFHDFAKRQYRKDEILIAAGEEPFGIIYLEEGYVRQYAISENGREATLNLYKPYTFFPMTWALNNTPNRYYFEALTEASVFVAPKAKVVEFVKTEPEVLYDLTQRLYTGIEGILKRMEFLLSGDSSKKLISILLISMERFAKEEEKSTISLKLKHKDLASQTGLSRETISREMKILEEKGVVSYQNNLITIKNLSALEEEFFGLNKL